MARFQSRVLFDVLAACVPISLGPELSVVTFCCHVIDETLIDVVICELVCEL